jgi:hypothetical protein
MSRIIQGNNDKIFQPVFKNIDCTGILPQIPELIATQPKSGQQYQAVKRRVTDQDNDLRALGDFGTTLMVAGNIPGRTQTLSMAIFDAVQANNLPRANELALILTSIGFGLLFFVLRVRQKTEESA